MATYRQLLGDISRDEVAEINDLMGGKQGLFFLKGIKEPASLIAFKWLPLSIYWGLGAGIAVYAKFIRGYNMLWLFAPFVPLWCMIFQQYVRQPNQEIENAYKYLLAKRAGTCAYELNQRRFSELAFT